MQSDGSAVVLTASDEDLVCPVLVSQLGGIALARFLKEKVSGVRANTTCVMGVLWDDERI